MRLADAALLATVVMLALATVLGAVIIAGRATRRSSEQRRTRVAAPARRLLLALTAGDEDPDVIDKLVTLPPAPWRAVEPTAIALLGKVRGEAHAALVTVFERRGAAIRATSELRRRDPVRRARAAEVLGNLRHAESVAPLAVLLHDPDPDVRVVAARSLGRIGDASAAVPLLSSLAQRRPVPSQIVAHAVARLGVGAQQHLITALQHADETVRATAVEVLGLIGAVGAATGVAAALSTDESVEVRVRAARTLGRLGTRSAIAPLLKAAEPAEPAALRAEAVRALGELGAVAAATPLAVLLTDPFYHVAHQAARALLRLGPTGHATLQSAVADTGCPSAAAHAREALGVAAIEDQRLRMTTAGPEHEPQPLVPVPAGG